MGIFSEQATNVEQRRMCLRSSRVRGVPHHGSLNMMPKSVVRKTMPKSVVGKMMPKSVGGNMMPKSVGGEMMPKSILKRKLINQDGNID